MAAPSRAVESWVALPGKLSTQRQRKDMLRNFVVANDFLPESKVPDTHGMNEEEKNRVWTSIYQAVDRGISTLRHNADSIIASINNLVGYMEKKGSSPTTISGHKFKLIKLYRWLKLAVSAEDLKEAVRKVDSVNVTDDRHLTREQVRDILKLHSSARQKALVSFMVCTGARIGEAVQVRVRDIDFTKTPAVVYFPARKTKTKRKRFSFLSSECVEFLKAHIAKRDRTRPSEWLFEGWIPNRKGRDTLPDKHAHPSAAYLQIRNVFATAGLIPPTPTKGRNGNAKPGANRGAHLEYHPHILRGTCIEFTKTCGYPPDWAEWLVGHDLKTQESYLPSEEKMSEEWLKKCESSFCFLRAKTDQPKQSYFEETIDSLANGKGMDHEEVKNAIIAILARGGDFKKIEAEMRAEAVRIRDATKLDLRPGVSYSIHLKPIEVSPEAVAARMTPEQVRPAVISWVKSLEPSTANAPDQPVDVDNGEMDAYLKLGWRFVSIVNSHKAIVRWERAGTPPHPPTSNFVLDESTKAGVSSQQ